jgi:hypothetical protein
VTGKKEPLPKECGSALHIGFDFGSALHGARGKKEENHYRDCVVNAYVKGTTGARKIGRYVMLSRV